VDLPDISRAGAAARWLTGAVDADFSDSLQRLSARLRGPARIRRRQMNTLVVAASVCVIDLASVSLAMAMPAAPLDQTETTAVIQIAGGCGSGWHRGPGGECRRNTGRVACGRGYRLTPHGCRKTQFF
jgi:uncharacterized membrane protein